MRLTGPSRVEWLAAQNAYFRIDDDTLTLYCYFAPRAFLPISHYQVGAQDCECGCVGGTSGKPTASAISEHLRGSIKDYEGE